MTNKISNKWSMSMCWLVMQWVKRSHIIFFNCRVDFIKLIYIANWVYWVFWCLIGRPTMYWCIFQQIILLNCHWMLNVGCWMLDTGWVYDYYDSFVCMWAYLFQCDTLHLYLCFQHFPIWIFRYLLAVMKPLFS